MARENQKQEGSLHGVYLAVLSTALVQYVAWESAADMCVCVCLRARARLPAKQRG
jgi:uncharacterized protein (DUF2132 family)